MPWIDCIQASIFSARTEDGLTPIHVAAAMSQPEAIRRLVSLGLDPTAASPLGAPATIAESEGHPEVARLLRDLA